MTREQMQRLEEEMVSQPVRSLQYMLRRISLRNPQLPELQPDGRFEERTLESVMRFQKWKGLEVDGVVDQETWSAIRDEWLDVERELAPPRQLRGFPEGAVVSPGESGEYLYVLQAMFHALSRVLEGVEEEYIDATHSGSSVNNVMWLQKRAQLPQTGNVDRGTWDALTGLYELFVVRAGYRDYQGIQPGRG